MKLGSTGPDVNPPFCVFQLFFGGKTDWQTLHFRNEVEDRFTPNFSFKGINQTMRPIKVGAVAVTVPEYHTLVTLVSVTKESNRNVGCVALTQIVSGKLTMYVHTFNRLVLANPQWSRFHWTQSIRTVTTVKTFFQTFSPTRRVKIITSTTTTI